MLPIRRITLEDLGILNEWYKNHKLGLLTPKMLPKVGFIYKNAIAGFLYKTDSDVALLDGYISNPRAKRTDVEKGCHFVTYALLEEARRSGYTKILAQTETHSIARMAKKWNFEETNMKVFIRSNK